MDHSRRTGSFPLHYFYTRCNVHIPSQLICPVATDHSRNITFISVAMDYTHRKRSFPSHYFYNAPFPSQLFNITFGNDLQQAQLLLKLNRIKYSANLFIWYGTVPRCHARAPGQATLLPVHVSLRRTWYDVHPHQRFSCWLGPLRVWKRVRISFFFLKFPT